MFTFHLSIQNQFLGSHKEVVQVLVIEVNTVPGMTPSTVLIQQVTFALVYLNPAIASVSFETTLLHYLNISKSLTIRRRLENQLFNRKNSHETLT